MIRLLLIVLTLLLGSCSMRSESLSLGEVEFMGLEGVTLAGDELPEQISLRVELENGSKSFSLREARLRVGIGRRRSLALTLTEPVHVRRGRSVVTLPIKITVVHNSNAMTLRNMFKQRKLSLIEFDLRAKVRRGIASRTMSFSSEDLEQSYAWNLLEKLFSFIEENTNEK